MRKETVHTLEDIARLANVSTSTVSRALNDSPLINAETRERIQAIAHEHNYRLNAPARNLRLKTSHTIAFAAPAYPPEFFSGEDLFGLEMLGGIGNGLHALGYDLLVVHIDPADSDWARAYLDSGRADGFILMTSALKPGLVRGLVEQGIPFIGWGAPLPDLHYCSVAGDNFAGGRLAAQRLAQIGRRRIAFLGGPAGSLTIQQRYQGYEAGLLAAGLAADPGLVTYSDYSYASGVAAMGRLLEQAPDLDAVFVNSDLMAIGAVKVLQGEGNCVPEDVAVIGYDDLPIAAYNNLPLTTVRQNIPLAGRLLAQNLIQHIQTGVITSVTIPVELVIRESA